MITDPGWSYIVAVLCRSKHLVSFPTFLGAFVPGWCPHGRDPSSPLSPWNDDLCQLSFRWLLLWQSWLTMTINTETLKFVSNYLKRFSSEKSHSQIGKWHFQSCALIMTVRCRSVQSSQGVNQSISPVKSVSQVMMLIRCQPVRSWCLFHCKELKGSPLNPRLASNFSLCRF